MAMRYGNAHEHVQIPIDGDHFTVILAHDGNRHLSNHAQARAWERLQDVYREITESRSGMDRLLHLELPRPVAAVVWRDGGHVTVVVSRTASRAHLKAILKSKMIPRSGGVVLAVAAAELGRHLARGAVPTAAAAAVTAAAVTAIAMPHIIGTGPRPSASAPARPGPLADDGDAYHRKFVPTPGRPPPGTPRPGGLLPTTPGVPPVALPDPGLPGMTPTVPPDKVRTPKPTKPPVKDRPKLRQGHTGGVNRSASRAQVSSCLLPRILQMVGRSVCGQN